MDSNSQTMNIKSTAAFKTCVPLVRISDDDYPTIGVAESTKRDKKRLKKQAKNEEKASTVISLGPTPWKEHRRSQQTKNYHPKYKNNNARDTAFGVLGDKEALAKNLECTRACNNVSRHGRCNRGTACKFAHSLEKLNDPSCLFGNDCRQKGNCRFKHVDETREEFYARTYKKMPNLPATAADIDTFANAHKARKISSSKSTPRNTPHNTPLTTPRNTPGPAGSGEITYSDMVNELLDEKENESTPLKVTIDESDDVTVLTVPAAMAEQTMALAIAQGRKNVVIVTV